MIGSISTRVKIASTIGRRRDRRMSQCRLLPDLSINRHRRLAQKLPPSFNPSIQVSPLSLDDRARRDAADGCECVGQAFGMSHDPHLRALGGANDQPCQRFQEVRMQARLGLVQRDEAGQAIAEQCAGKRQIAQRAVGQLVRLEHALRVKFRLGQAERGRPTRRRNDEPRARKCVVDGLIELARVLPDTPSASRTRRRGPSRRMRASAWSRQGMAGAAANPCRCGNRDRSASPAGSGAQDRCRRSARDRAARQARFPWRADRRRARACGPRRRSAVARRPLRSRTVSGRAAPMIDECLFLDLRLQAQRCRAVAWADPTSMA